VVLDEAWHISSWDHLWRHRFNFRSKPVSNWNGIINCELLVVEPNQQLSDSWGSMELESMAFDDLFLKIGMTRHSQ